MKRISHFIAMLLLCAGFAAFLVHRSSFRGVWTPLQPGFFWTRFVTLFVRVFVSEFVFFTDTLSDTGRVGFVS